MTVRRRSWGIGALLAASLAGAPSRSAVVLAPEQESQDVAFEFVGERSMATTSATPNPEDQIKFWLDVLGSGLSTATLAVTAWAAVAAMRAARAAEAGTLVAQASVSVAQAALGAGRDASRNQLRAYVCVEAAAIAMDPRSRRHMARVTLKNVGATPARIVEARCDIHYAAYPLAEELDAPEPDHAPSAPVLGAGGEFHLEAALAAALGTGDVDEMRRGLSAVYMVGHVKYVDVFDKVQVSRWLYFTGGSFAGPPPLVAPYHTGNTMT